MVECDSKLIKQTVKKDKVKEQESHNGSEEKICN